MAARVDAEPVGSAAEPAALGAVPVEDVRLNAPAADAEPVRLPLPAIGPAAPAGDRWAHRRAEPRPWALMWTGYLLLATVASLGSIASAPFLAPDIYRPAATLLLAATALGVAVFWPMVRLSQQLVFTSAPRGVFLDSLAILFPLQATIWPQAMSALSNWDWSVTAVIAAQSAAWLGLIGAVLALALQDIHGHEGRHGRVTMRRGVWMVVILGIGFAGPLAIVVRSLLGLASGERIRMWLTLVSPVTSVFEVTRDRSWLGRNAVAQPEHWRAAQMIAVAALTLWLVAIIRGLTTRVERRGGGPTLPEQAESGPGPSGPEEAVPVVGPDRTAFN